MKNKFYEPMILNRIHCRWKERREKSMCKYRVLQIPRLMLGSRGWTGNRAVRGIPVDLLFSPWLPPGRGYPWPESIINRLARVPRLSPCHHFILLCFRHGFAFSIRPTNLPLFLRLKIKRSLHLLRNTFINRETSNTERN